MNTGLFRALIPFHFFILSLYGMFWSAVAQAQAPTITATATSSTTLEVRLSNSYASVRIEEKVGSSWVQVSQSTIYTATRAAGIYAFRGYSCYPTTPSVCNYSSSVSVTLVGNSPPANPVISASLRGASVYVSWSALVGAPSYQLTRNGAALSAAGVAYTDSNVVGGISYTYTVKACNSYGCSSGASVTITYPAVPAVPQLTAGLSGASVALSWTAPANAVSYQLKRGTTSLPASGTSYSDSGVVAGNTYTYTVKACNSAGLCSADASSSISVPPIPAVPTVTATFGGATVVVSWNAPTGATSYQVQRNGATVSSSGTRYTELVTSANTSYTYTVKACNSNNQCSAAGTATVAIPSGPLFQVDAVGSNTIRVTVGNVYSWHIQELVGSSWRNASIGTGGGIGSPASFTVTKPGGTHSFRLYNCYPITDGCSTSPSRSVSLVGTPPPPAPTLATSMSGTSVLANWNTVAGAASYELKRNTTLLSATGTSYTDSAVTPGTAYTYTLRACNATGECSAFSTSSITPPAIPATPSLSSQFNTAAKAIVLSWTRPTGTYDFRFRRSTTTTTTNETSYTDTSISSGGSYTYGIRACNSVGQCSAEATLNVAVPAIPAAPVVSATVGAGVINVSWTAPTGTSSYQLMRGTASLSASGATYADSAVTAGTSYTYTVKACNVIGDCSTAGTATITYPAVPAIPQLNATLNGASVVLSWNAPVYAITYQLKRGTTTLSASGTSHTDPAVAPGNSYTYTLKACNSAGVCSSEVSATISVPPIPAVPTVTATFGGATVVVSWNAPTGATSYQVQRNGATVSSSGTRYTELVTSANTSYTYTVRACNSNNQCSAAGSATVNVPNAPLFQVDATGPNTITITVRNVYSWRVEEEISSGSWSTIKGDGASGNPPPVTVTRLAGTYKFRLYNCYPTTNGCSTSSTQTVILVGTPPPENPVIDVISAGEVINVSWTSSANAVSYQLRKNNAPVTLPVPSATSFTDSAVASGASYTYTVKACNASGACSSGVSKSLKLPLAMPQLTLLNVAGGVFVGWSSIAGATSYQITRNSANVPWASSTNFLDTNVSSGQEYTYSIRACNVDNECSVPNIKSIIYVPNPSFVPPVPSVTAGFGGASVVVNWSVSPGATSYKVTHAGKPEFSVSGNTYQDTGISPGSRSYSIKACNVDGQCSAAASATTTVPSGPYFEAEAVGPNTIRFLVGSVYAWNIRDVTTAGGAQVAINTTPLGGVSAYTITRPAGTYSFQLHNCYNSGTTPCSTSSSKTVLVTGGQPPARPVITAVLNGARIDISWTESAGAEYYRLTRNGEQLSPAGSAYLDSLVVPGTIYTYRVTACTATAGCSAEATAIIKVPAVPLVPAITAVMNGSSVYVNWTASEDAISYELVKGANTALTPSGRAYTDSNVVPGSTYTYSVKACNRAPVCSAPATASITVPQASGADDMVISPLLVGSQVNDPAPREKPTGHFIGSLKGDFRVNEMGAATYAVPIAIPDGIAGVKPQLSLMYSSQGGNGLLGKGWALNGLSGITRCRQTLIQDGQAAPIAWNSGDRFCLDGKRLMLVSNGSSIYGDPETVYKTEIDTFVTVTAKGGTAGKPDYFEVKGKDGSTAFYGGIGADSSELSTPKGVLTWGIKNFKDNVGNPISFVYEGGTTNYRVREIRYAFSDKNPDSTSCGAFVSFGYESRTSSVSGNTLNDDQSAFIAGVEIKNTSRLASISAYNGGCSVTSATLSRMYKLNYASGTALMPNSYISQINSISECANASTCYPATTFDWSKPNEVLSYGRDFGSLYMGGGSLGTTQFLDVNGNGMADMVWSNFGGGTWSASYALDVGSKTGFRIKKSLNVHYNDSNGKNPPRFLPIDYNGDARQDLLVYSGDVLNNPPRWRLYLSVPTNDGWELREQTATNSNITLPFATEKDLHVADIDSDGMSEVVGFYPLNSGLRVYSLTPRFAASDTAGHTSSTYYSFLGGGFYGFLNAPVDSLVIDTEADNAMTFADFNGDGKMDVAVRYKGAAGVGNSPSPTTYRVFVANNNYQFEYYATLDTPTAGDGHVIDKIIAADINGDGLADTAYFLGKLVCQTSWGGRGCKPEEGDWFFRLNTGDGFAAPVLLANTPDEVVFADMNHDGKMDFVSTKKNSSGRKDIRIQYWSSATNNLTAGQILFPDVAADVNYQFADTNGDSWVDAISMQWQNSQIKMETKGHSSRSDATTGVVPSDQIYRITDGLGNVTSITYAPLGRSANYSPIGDIKITAETYQRCHGEIINPYGPGSGTKPAGCEDAIAYDIDTAKFYKQINSPFLPLVDGGQVNAIDRIYSPVLEVLGPVTLVTQVESTAPSTASETPGNMNAAARNKVEYFYRHLRMQAGGRGMLGFESLITLDTQTGVKTETRYRQDWPYIGSPLETIVQASDGKILSRATNTWSRRMVDGANVVDGVSKKGRRYQPYILQSVEETFAYGSDGTGTTIDSSGKTSGAALQTVTTDIVMSNDDYGNVASMVITTEGGGDELVKSTVNEYVGNDEQQRLARLTSATVTTTRNGVADSERKVSFTYYPIRAAEKGLLWTETVEGGASEQLVTTYTYDGWGNKSGVSVVGSGQTRTTTNNYGDDGRYLVSSSNGLGQESTITGRDPATGQATGVSDVNEITAEVLYDDMGREYLRVDETGAWTRTDISNCSSNCPTGARYVTTTRVSGGGITAVYYDALGRVLRNAKVGFDGSWIYVDTEYDVLGRVKHQSTPYFSNRSPAGWSSTKYDFLGRIKQVTLPDGSSSSSTYRLTTQGMETVTTNHLSQTQTELRNGLGQLLKVTDNLGGTVAYTYTIKGDLLTATTDDSPSASPNVAPVTVTMCYDGLGRKIAMNDPDKGGFTNSGTASCSQIQSWVTTGNNLPAGWWLYRYNAFGELVWQRDPKAQVTTMTYDALGRMDYRSASDESTTWFYDTPLAGASSTSATKGKLTAIISRATPGKLTHAASSCTNSDYCSETMYDGLGRPVGTTTHLPDGQDHITTMDYDSIGRAYQSTDVLQAVFSRSGIQTHFNEYGYAYRTVDMATMNGANSALSTILAMNARGQVTEELRSNGAVTTNAYNENTGLLEGQEATVTGLLAIQDNTYEWDALGNLKFRASAGAKIGSQQLKAKEEGFCYDGLNRLTSVLPSRNPACNGTPQIEYDGLGNITKKQGVGNYVYDRTNGGPHAVTSVNNNPYRYDLNGNATSGDGRNFYYTSYDMVKEINRGGADKVKFLYGPDHKRWQRVETKGSTTTTTTYLGNIERISTNTNAVVEWKRTVAGVVHTYKTLNLLLQARGNDKRYLYTDHLGSVDAITDAVGNVTHSMSFDAWGARRSGEDWAAITATQLKTSLTLASFDQPVTTRGYTGHEMVDDYGIIHMNGRIYDARIGRFLQADPFIQAASNTQSYNRYSYVMNNPLNSTDPSGYFSLRKFVGVIVAAVMTYYCGPNCGKLGYALITGAVAGGAQAAANGQNILQGMVFGAVSAAAFYGVGQAFSAGGQTFGSADALTKFKWAASQGMAGGTLSVMQGGKFGHGFASAFVTKYTNVNDIVGTAAEQAATRVVVAAIIGGTVSEMTGGKFANGAISSALMQAVNGNKEAKIEEDKKMGIIGYSEDGVPTFDETNKKYHHYYLSNSCLKSTAGCTLANVKAGLLRYPAPGASGNPIKDEQEGFAMPVGSVRHEVQNNGAEVINVTLEGRHTLYPGIVRRWVSEDSLSVTVHTFGEGTGRFGAMNVAFAEDLWGQVDSNIWKYISKPTNP